MRDKKAPERPSKRPKKKPAAKRLSEKKLERVKGGARVNKIEAIT